MDDIQLLIYILLIGFGLFSRFLKAKGKKAKPPKQPRADGETQERPVTFEELLKEFTGEAKETPREVKPVEIEEPNSPQTPPTPSYEYEDDEIKERYESSVQKAAEIKTINELVDLEEGGQKIKFDHFEAYDEQEKEESEFVKFLRMKDGARKAIILGEILNRRY